MLSADRERMLLARAQRGDASATTELVESHKRLVVQIAARYAREGLSIHDLMGEGTLGVLEAVRRFDLGREVRFASYAAWWIRSCVRSYALSNRRIVRMPDTRGARKARARIRSVERTLGQSLGSKPNVPELARALGISENDVELTEAGLSFRDVALSSDADGGVELQSHDDNPEEAVARVEDVLVRNSSVRRALAELDERERLVIGAQLSEEAGQSLADLGATLGVSRQRAGQILANARCKLKVELACVV